MKLISLKVGNLPPEKQFRSLNPGFELNFHNLDDEGLATMQTFSPFCFAGLNGSGKSNVLEALSAIFFHIECCVAKFKPESFERHFKRNECALDAFTLVYLIGLPKQDNYLIESFFKITITKQLGLEPKLFRQSYPFTADEPLIEESLVPSTIKNNQDPAPGKIYLPDVVVGYSSGENEILSLPFRKSRLLNFDKYIEDYEAKRPFSEPENSLIYVDSEMSQAVLLACLLFEDPKTTLRPIKEELKIQDIRSFRMHLNNLYYERQDAKSYEPILTHIDNIICSLKKCATSWYEHKEEVELQGKARIMSILTLDFFVEEDTKRIFKTLFKDSFELFRFFQVLYELNSTFVNEGIKEEVYKSKGFYIDGKIPVGSPEQNVFYFLDYLILKKIDANGPPKELLLREFSDGEHQFLHTMGICLMLKNRRSILLLDEPETHFNPSWRAKFVKLLGDSIAAGAKSKINKTAINLHLMKDVILTSHSPFIISDCLPNNVVLFKKDKSNGRIHPKTAKEINFNTYGTSVDLILQEIFEMDYSISLQALSEIKALLKNKSANSIIEGAKRLGESYEKGFLYERIEELKKKNNLNSESQE